MLDFTDGYCSLRCARRGCSIRYRRWLQGVVPITFAFKRINREVNPARLEPLVVDRPIHARTGHPRCTESRESRWFRCVRRSLSAPKTEAGIVRSQKLLKPGANLRKIARREG